MQAHRFLVCLLALLLHAALGDTVYRGSGPISASSGKGCGYDQALLQHVCLACNASHCSVYSIKYRANPVIERSDIPLSTPSALTFTVRSGRRLAYIYFSNNSLIQYNMDNWRAAPLDTGFAYTSVASTACGTVTLTAPVHMTVTPDGRAYGILTTSANCANTLHVVEFDVPPPGATTGGASTTTTVITFAAQGTPGTVAAIAASSKASSTSGTFFLALTSGSCSGTSYVKVLPRGSSPSATQLTCASATCSLTATTVSGIMLDYMDLGDTLIAAHSACNTLVGITTSGTLKVLAGNGQSGYQDGYATSEARIAAPSSPAVTARRVFMLTTDADTAFLVGRLTGATNTESMSKTRSPQSVSEALSSTPTVSRSVTLTPSRTPTDSPTDIPTASPTNSVSPTASDATHTMEASVTPTTSRTSSGTIASPSQSFSAAFSATRSATNTHTASNVASSSPTETSSSSRTVTHSSSASRSLTASTANASISAPLSPSDTITAVMSVTDTRSASASPSFTLGRQNTRTWMVSPSTTKSGSLSKTNSPSQQDVSATISKQRTSRTWSPSKVTLSGNATVSMAVVSRSHSVLSPTASYTSRQTISPTASSSVSPSSMQSSSISDGATARGLIAATASLSASRSTSLSMDASTSETYVVTVSHTSAATASFSSSTSTSMSVTLTTTRPLFYPIVGETEGWKSIVGGVVGGFVALGIVGGVVAAKKAGVFGGSAALSAHAGGHGGGAAAPASELRTLSAKHSPTSAGSVRAASAPRADADAPSPSANTSGSRYAAAHRVAPPTQMPFEDKSGGMYGEPFDVIEVRGDTPLTADLEMEGEEAHTLPWWATGGAPPPPLHRVPPTATVGQGAPVSATSSTALRRLLEMQDVSFGCGDGDSPAGKVAPTTVGDTGHLPPHSDFEALDEASGDDTLWFEDDDHQPH